MHLRCILLASPFQFFKISRSSDDKKHKGKGDVDMEVEVDEVDEKW